LNTSPSSFIAPSLLPQIQVRPLLINSSSKEGQLLDTKITLVASTVTKELLQQCITAIVSIADDVIEDKSTLIQFKNCLQSIVQSFSGRLFSTTNNRITQSINLLKVILDRNKMIAL